MKNKVLLTDLRLGNWLYDSKPSGFPMQISALGKDWVQLDFEGNEGDCFENSDKEVYPIPLTEELFLNMGFKKVPCKLDKNDYTLMKDNMFVSFIYKHTFGISINGSNGIFIDYVHELQNVYHTLTNKELKIEREWI